MSKHSKKRIRKIDASKRIIVFLLAIVLLLSAVSVFLLVRLVSLKKENKKITSSYESHISSLQSSEAEPPVSSEVSSIKPDDWKLRLANSENVLPSDFTVETGLITPAYARDKGMSFDARAVDELNAMLAAANEDGVNLLVISCFRTINYQTNLYNREVDKWLNQGYNETDAKAKAATIVAVPGTSDHNLGLAVDLNSVEESFQNTRQFTWLQEYAEEYGFVMRYPKHKQDITKIIYEPWHYRYVGKEAAKEMNDLDMCLEEYVVYLNGSKR